MADNYTVYENLYNFMNDLLNPVQGTSGSGQGNVRTAGTGKTTEGRSFAETFRNEVGAPGVTGVPQSMDAIFEEAAGLRQFEVFKIILKPYFRLIFLSNFSYFYVVCAVCLWYNVFGVMIL